MSYARDPVNCSDCNRLKEPGAPGWAYVGLDGDPWLYCPRCLEMHARLRERREAQQAAWKAEATR